MDPKTVFEPHIEPKNCPILTQPQNSPLGPLKIKSDLKISQNQMSELKETKKMKVVQQHERTPKQLSKPTRPQNSPLGPKKVKNDHKIKSK